MRNFLSFGTFNEIVFLSIASFILICFIVIKNTLDFAAARKVTLPKLQALGRKTVKLDLIKISTFELNLTSARILHEKNALEAEWNRKSDSRNFELEVAAPNKEQ